MKRSSQNLTKSQQDNSISLNQNTAQKEVRLKRSTAGNLGLVRQLETEESDSEKNFESSKSKQRRETPAVTKRVSNLEKSLSSASSQIPTLTPNYTETQTVPFIEKVTIPSQVQPLRPSSSSSSVSLVSTQKESSTQIKKPRCANWEWNHIYQLMYLVSLYSNNWDKIYGDLIHTFHRVNLAKDKEAVKRKFQTVTKDQGEIWNDSKRREITRKERAQLSHEEIMQLEIKIGDESEKEQQERIQARKWYENYKKIERAPKTSERKYGEEELITEMSVKNSERKIVKLNRHLEKKRVADAELAYRTAVTCMGTAMLELMGVGLKMTWSRLQIDIEEHKRLGLASKVEEETLDNFRSEIEGTMKEWAMTGKSFPEIMEEYKTNKVNSEKYEAQADTIRKQQEEIHQQQVETLEALQKQSLEAAEEINSDSDSENRKAECTEDIGSDCEWEEPTRGPVK